MNKDFILKKRKDFVRVAKGVYAVTTAVVLQAAPSLSKENTDYKVGFTTTKKIGKAHVRNRARRMMRAAAREIFPQLGQQNTEYVMVARATTTSCTMHEMKKDLRWAIRKVHKLMEEEKNKPVATETPVAAKKSVGIIALTALVRFYQKFISPICPGCCRFQPTCSQYMIEALQKHGVFKGLFLGIKRILHCHPWGKSGFDPVPEPKQSQKKKSQSKKFKKKKK